MNRAEPDLSTGVTVVVPTLNRGPYLLNTLKDLLLQKHRPLEVVVVDQSEVVDSEIAGFIDQNGSCIKHCRVAFRGLPKARNFGWQRASFDIILFVDDDIRCGSGLVSEHVRALGVEGVGAVAGGIREVGVTGESPKRPGVFNRWTANPARGFDYEGEVEVDHVPGGNFSGHRAVIKAAGGFDESLGVGAALYEETEFSLRVRALDYQIRFNGRASLDHLAAGSGGCRVPDIKVYLWALGHNRAVVIRRHLAPIFWPTSTIRVILLATSYSIEYGTGAALASCLRGFVCGWRRATAPPDCTNFLDSVGPV